VTLIANTAVFLQGQSFLTKYLKAIRFVYRDAPLGPVSPFEVAQASMCAYDQDYLWEYHDALFENQDRLGAGL
jgi:protein-disulfide isomerase